jgi:YVTN family beta-propeller protein
VVNSNNVSVINGATNAVSPITVGNQPNAVAVNAVTNKIYVTNYVDASVSVIDGATNTVTGSVSVGIHPDAIAVNPVTNKIYVACLGGGGTVTVIDGATNTPSQPIQAGDWPLAIAVNPTTNKIYVANSNLDSYPTPGSVTVIDGTTNTPTNINAGVEPFAIAVNPLTNQIYAANKDGNSILVINGSTNATTTLSVGTAPFAIAVNPVSNKIYVPNAGAVSGSYYISVIDGATNNIETLSAGSQPAAAAVNPMNNQIYIANQVSNNLTTLIEQQVQTIQIVTTITPLSGNATTSSSPTFHFTTANNFTTGAPINNLVYQVDTWTGTWTAATSNGSGNFSGNAASLQPGYHVIYAYATEGEEGTSGAGPEGSAVIGNIAAYGFLVTGGSSSGANVSPNGINFGGQVKLLSSSPQTVTLSNSSNSVLTFSIAISGTNAGDFAEPSASPDTCTALAGQLAANTSCNIAVIFTPQATGARSATLTVTDSLNGGQNQNQTVSLSGIGTGNQVATLAWTPGNIPYGSTASSVPSPTATYQSSNVPGTFAFTPALNTLTVGNQNVSVTFTPTDPTNFASVTQNFSVTVVKATLTVSATSATRVYGLANPAFVGSYTGFVNGDTAATALSGAPAFSTTATATSSVGNYPITVTQGTLASTNYAFVFTAGNLAVTQATTTVSWGPLAPMTAGSALGATQLSATATSGGVTVPGTFTYNPPAGTVLATGTQTLSATFAPAADGNSIVDYTTPAAATVTVQVNQAQAIAGTNDTATQGNWIGVYGGDGYNLAPTTSNPPSYATVQVQNQTNFTWISPTTDARALLDPSGSTRTAAAWYAITSFNFDINITDGQSHPMAFYVVDWDSIGRAETITLTDAVTHATLSTQSVSNFGNGAYLKWTVSGHITVTVTATSGNAVVSGIFFGGSSGTESVTVAPHSSTLSGGGTQQFTATIHNASPQSFTWAIQSVNPVGADQGTLSATGFYTAPATITTAATVTVAATSADGLATGTATVSLTTGSGGTGTGGNTASFATLDSTTGGTWIGVYGSDGYQVANVTPASLPSYASVTVGSQANYTWAATTTDPRALETGLGNARIASTWYSQTSFTIDVNITDGNAHQVALYGVDWDGQGRSETIQVADGTTGAQLDSRTLTNFGNGTYMVWNISGHVKFTITKQIGSNSVLSGIFFAPSSGGTGGGGTETVTVTPNSTTLAGGATQQMGATVTNASSQTVTWSITAVNPTGAAQGTISTAGLYSAPATITTAATVTITATSADGTATGTASITLTAGSGGGTGTGGTAVAFVKSDTTTSGTWMGVYGGDGFQISNVTPASLPSYATMTLQNAASYSWAQNTTDPRALQTGSGSNRLPSAFYSNAGFSLDLNLTDGNTHQVAFYAVDWDLSGRTEKLQITDAVSGNQLDSQTISGFNNGVWLVWNISGHVHINVSGSAGPNALLSGVFFAPSGGTTGGGGTETVTVTPNSTTLSSGGTQQMSATVTNASSQTVTWSITAVSPTGAAQGSISSTGLYMAPATITTAATVTITATSADGTATGTASITLNAGSGGTGTGGNAVAFVKLDTTTGGTWIGMYGGDGRAVANVTPTSLPSYASVTVGNQANYTWEGTTSDPRALETGLGNARIASTWYSQTSFTIDVNIADSNTHQIALYGVDWDGEGRSETIQVADGTTGAQLDNRTLTNFLNGTYVIYNISGHVKFTITKQVGANSVISGIFFAPSSGGTGGGGTETVTVAPNSTTLAGGATQQMGATVTNASSQTVTWSITAVNPTGAAQGTISTAGLYSAPATITTAATVTITATSADGTATGTASITLTAGSGGGTGTGGTAVAFVKSDTTTSGTWIGVYGGDGKQIANVTPASLPSYATMTIQNAASYSWLQSTSDPRALETGSGSNRLPSAFYSNAGFYVDLNLTDGNTHQVAFYVVDWDMSGRTEKLQITDAVSGSQLDSQTISGFNNGVWLVWNISGHVHINVTGSAGPNALLSGIFFDPVPGGGAEAVSVTPNSTTLAGGATQQMNATVSNGPNQTVTWAITAVNPSGAAQGTISSTGLYSAPATITTAAAVTITATSSDGTAAGTATINLSAGGTGTAGTAVAFVKKDTTTQGTWLGVYGTSGNAVANVTPSSIPAFASFSVQNQANYTWEATTTDPRALETGLGNARIASAWYSNSSFYIDLNFTDGNTHQFSIYAVDWDLGGRTEQIQVIDAVSGTPLNTQTLSSFTNGAYLVWNISGHVKIVATPQVGANALINGAFFQ